ncbi:MAG TPA: hypothetical protein VMU07_00930 [Candidatus Paceibacterota bacterium]|nr:hypothetical protein [Candidatus Paceibacterota bacterium]
MAAIGFIAVGVFGASTGSTLSPADVGVTVGVAPNPYNTLNAQLDQRQKVLDAEASNLQAEEAALNSQTSTFGNGSESPMIGFLMIAVGVLAFLVGLNFYFDWHRSTQGTATPA